MVSFVLFYSSACSLISTMFRLDRTKILNLEAKGHPFFDGLTNNAS